jgi:hypothetical protein
MPVSPPAHNMLVGSSLKGAMVCKGDVTDSESGLDHRLRYGAVTVTFTATACWATAPAEDTGIPSAKKWQTKSSVAIQIRGRSGSLLPQIRRAKSESPEHS